MRTIAVNLTNLQHNDGVLSRIIILLLLVTLPSMALTGTIQLPSKVSQELKNQKSYQDGAKAMADHLHDVAVLKFRESLTDDKLSSTAKPYVTLSLIEALVRTSISSQGTPQQAEEALKLLENEAVQKLTSAPIWKAEAMASLGRYNEADKALAQVPASHPLQDEIQLARARILLALERIPEALNLLIQLGQKKSSKVRNAANLLAAEIHINQGQYDNATKTLELIDGQVPTDAMRKEYLAARLALAKGNADDAASRFQSLISAPNDLDERIFHACILGKADALAANQQTDAALKTLEQFIENYPDSPDLALAFARLPRLLPIDSANETPIFTKLKEWSGEANIVANSLYIAGDSTAHIPIYQNESSEFSDRVSLALYYRAIILARSEDTQKQTLAMALLAKLRVQNNHTSEPLSELYLRLSSASLLDTAYLHLKQNQPVQATFTLSVMEKVAFSPRLKDQASILRGLLLAQENKVETALEAFDYARQSSSKDIANAATINAGIMALKATHLEAFNEVFDDSQSAAVRTTLALERALWKCSQLDPIGRAEIEAFIMAHTGHPRENEARLALAAACVNIPPHDLVMAKAQLDMIAPRLTDAANQLAITRIMIRAEELAQNWMAAATAAEKYILQFPESPHIPSLQFKRGEAYYHNEDYNKARQIFQAIPEKFPDSPFAPHANFLAAMSARLGGTPQAREESIKMFQKIIEGDHPLASEARIQQSRLLIDLRQYEEAEKKLSPLLDSKDTPVVLRRAAGVLMADCLHRQGAADSENYTRAINIYNDLLLEKDLPLAWKNRLHYLRGQTYESMSRISDAFNSYYDVVINSHAPQGNGPHEEEWLWFYRCGFKALAILENDKRWEAAVQLARRIASFNGPRAEEAAKRANSLAKTHMIWEHVDPDPIPPKPAEDLPPKAVPEG